MATTGGNWKPCCCKNGGGGGGGGPGGNVLWIDAHGQSHIPMPQALVNLYTGLGSIVLSNTGTTPDTKLVIVWTSLGSGAVGVGGFSGRICYLFDLNDWAGTFSPGSPNVQRWLGDSDSDLIASGIPDPASRRAQFVAFVNNNFGPQTGMTCDGSLYVGPCGRGPVSASPPAFTRCSGHTAGFVGHPLTAGMGAGNYRSFGLVEVEGNPSTSYTTYGDAAHFSGTVVANRAEGGALITQNKLGPTDIVLSTSATIIPFDSVCPVDSGPPVVDWLPFFSNLLTLPP